MIKTSVAFFSSSSFQLPIAVDDGKALFKTASKLPFLFWPNGRWCFAANVYMLQLFKQGKSIFDNGGTLKTYATYVSHLIRFCHHNNIDFIDLTDSYFTLFINALVAERKSEFPKDLLRNTTSVIAIGQCCLAMLSATGDISGRRDFVSLKGVIRAEWRPLKSPLKRGVAHSSWFHHSFPLPAPTSRRLPVADIDHFSMLQSASQHPNIFIRKRKFIMLLLLEITGCRRSELVRIRTQDVLNQFHIAYPMLKVSTSKTRLSSGAFRFIPVSAADIKILVEYIRVNRDPLIRKTIGKNRDHGYLFINSKTAAKLESNTITQEIQDLAVMAKISHPVSPHMYRHRFITNLFRELIHQHSRNNPDEFKRALLGSEALKYQVTQWTGHKSTESLEPYIHLAYAIETQFESSVDGALVSKRAKSKGTILQQAISEIRNGHAGRTTIILLESLLLD